MNVATRNMIRHELSRSDLYAMLEGKFSLVNETNMLIFIYDFFNQFFIKKTIEINTLK
jgi:hypothetical protein